MLKIERAQKKKQKLKIALAGISGSGKTYSALTLAFSMCKKVCVIDTECGSASLYSDHFPEYDVLELNAPYSPQRYVEAINMAEAAGYECIIVDSLSHEWSGSGGCLDMVNAVSKAGGNSYTAWGKVTPHHDALISRMISAQTHIIVTMRTKTAYEITTNDKGKQAPVKVGTAPTQRDGVEYEFTIVFDIDQNHNFTCSKDRTSMFNNVDIPHPLNADVGKKILAWLESGVEPTKVESKNLEQQQNSAATRQQNPARLNDTPAQSELVAEALKIYRAVDAMHKSGRVDEAVLELNIKDWYSLCNKYMIVDDKFSVPQDVAEKMHAILNLPKPLAIHKGYIDYGDDVIHFSDIFKSEVKEAVNS